MKQYFHKIPIYVYFNLKLKGFTEQEIINEIGFSHVKISYKKTGNIIKRLFEKRVIKILPIDKWFIHKQYILKEYKESKCKLEFFKKEKPAKHAILLNRMKIISLN